MTPFQGVIAVPATQEAEVCRGCRPFAFVPSVHHNTRSRFAWYGPELPRHVDTRSRAGVPLVGNGIPWVDIAERECSIVIIANSCRRPNRELPVGRRMADAVSNGGVQKHVLGCRLPDDAEQRRVVRPLALGVLAIDLADEPKLRMERQLANDAPDAEQMPHPVETTASVDVHGDRRQPAAHDPDRLESDAMLAGQ